MLKSVQLISFKRSSDNASLRTFLDFNSLKSPLLFLGFWVTETGYWPVPFSLDEALQLGRLLISLFLMPGSWKKSYEKEKKTSNGLDKFVQTIFPDLNFGKMFIMNNLTDFRLKQLWICAWTVNSQLPMCTLRNL